jgi:hypothetical protein
MRFAGRMEPGSVSGMFATGQTGPSVALADFAFVDDFVDDFDLVEPAFVDGLAGDDFPVARDEFCAAAFEIWPKRAEADIISAPKHRRAFRDDLMSMVGVGSA